MDPNNSGGEDSEETESNTEEESEEVECEVCRVEEEIPENDSQKTESSTDSQEVSVEIEIEEAESATGRDSEETESEDLESIGENREEGDGETTESIGGIYREEADRSDVGEKMDEAQSVQEKREEAHQSDVGEKMELETEKREEAYQSDVGEKMDEAESVQEKREEEADVGEKMEEIEIVEEKREEADAGEKMDEAESVQEKREEEADVGEKMEETDQSVEEKREETDQSVEEKMEETEIEEKIEETVTAGPDWYQALMNKRFVENCEVHQENRRNVFCFRCCTADCCDCVGADHHSHPRIQVRMSIVGDDMFEKDEIYEFLDSSQIQIHLSASREKVIRKRPVHGGKSIEECKRRVHPGAIFCSLYCKAEHVLDTEGDLSSITKLAGLGLETTSGNDHDPMVIKTSTDSVPELHDQTVKENPATTSPGNL